MKLVTYVANSTQHVGMLVGNSIIDFSRAHAAYRQHATSAIDAAPADMIAFLRGGEAALADAAAIIAWHADGATGDWLVDASTVSLCSPVPRPTSMRDGYAFRQHVEAARRNHGLEMIAEFDEIPIFYFTNHQAVYGPGDIPVRELHCHQLDFELECAIVIGKEGRNISVGDADAHIAGLLVMNDWSARALQMQEMKLNLGPAKGKDFATSLGPWLVTLDELAPFRVDTGKGAAFDLAMTTTVNGTEVSRGNVKDMSWTFAQIIERASYGVTLYPGDVIGSGTCGTGCFLELNGSKVYDPAWWLKPGDQVVCSIDALGSLHNTIVMEQL